jgi:hypothetical protein
MEQFTSGTQTLQGRKVNHDDEPWAVLLDGVEIDRYATESQAERHAESFETITYALRPEFAVHDNPVLLDIRTYRNERLTMRNPKGWDHVLRKFQQHKQENPWNATPEQIDQALRVLTHLAALG